MADVNVTMDFDTTKAMKSLKEFNQTLEYTLSLIRQINNSSGCGSSKINFTIDNVMDEMAKVFENAHKGGGAI